MPHAPGPRRFSPLLTLALLLFAGCGDDGPGDLPRDAAVDASPTDAATGADAGPSQRNARYCEVIPLYLEASVLRADVWNTRPFNDCPQDAWDALDATAIKAELGAFLVRMNGPRYFLMDAGDVDLSGLPTHTFGTLEMMRFATFEIDLATASQDPYTERAIARDTRFHFWTGSEIYELHGPSGAAYVMQSYALTVDPDLAMEDLPGLGSRLQLPAGWTYQVRVLTAPLEVSTVDGEAVVVQDELENTYQRYLAP